MRVGYACICLGGDGLRCQRTTVLKNATPERLRELIRENIDGLEGILRYNEARGFHLFRLGNEFIPFASHPVNELRWWEEFAWRLRVVGDWVKRHGHRLSFHASHFTILNSIQPHVRAAALEDITYLARVLEAMGLGAEHKIIVHLGVTTPTVEAAQARFEESIAEIPREYRRHLAIENDDRYYTAEQALEMSRQTDIPVVLDVFHHQVLPGEWADMPCRELLDRAFATWGPEHGVPKIHFSTQDPEKRPGAHGYGIDPAELERFLEQSRTASRDFDVMFESKGKDLSVEAVMPVVERDPRFQPLALAA